MALGGSHTANQPASTSVWVTLIIILVAARPGSFQFIQIQSADILTSHHLFVGGGHLFLSSTESFLLFFGLTRIFLPTLKQYIDVTTNNEYTRFY